MKHPNVPKNILVIDDKNRWRLLRNFEHRQNRLFLKNLSENRSLKLFLELYQFVQMIGGSFYSKKSGLKK